jgi:hypothetical protein
MQFYWVHCFCPVTGWTAELSEVESWYGKDFCPLHVVKTGSRAHPTSYKMGTGALSSGVKRPVREADQSPPTSTEMKNTWIYTSTPPYVYVA